MPKGYSRDAKPASEQPPPPRATRILVGSPEAQGWFQRLPAAAKEEFRARWRSVGALDAKREQFSRTSLKRSIAQATIVFVVNETCCAMPSFWHSLAALVVGVGLGAYWHRTAAGRFRCMISSIAPYVGLRVAFTLIDDRVPLVASLIFAVLGFVTLLGLTALVGYVREGRRADDQDY